MATHRSAPNFVTSKRVEGRTVVLLPNQQYFASIKGKVVCIENADPGYDWIFTKGISGLITKFGGANSHMAIRCGELGIPAAIGCGEELFSRLSKGGAVILDCSHHVVKPVHGP